MTDVKELAQKIAAMPTRERLLFAAAMLDRATAPKMSDAVRLGIAANCIRRSLLDVELAADRLAETGR